MTATAPTGRDARHAASAAADACLQRLSRRYGAERIAATALRRAFTDVAAAFWGESPDYLPCDTPYHDLQHSLDTAVLAAQLVDAFDARHPASGDTLGPTEATLTVLLALLHDTGFLRRPDEAHLAGAALTRTHEARSVDFVRTYAACTPWAVLGDHAELIQTTNLARVSAADAAAAGFAPAYRIVARIVGSADLLAQLADPDYLERCRDFLYHEFVIAGLDRGVDAGGQPRLIYADGNDLLRQTPGFYRHLVVPRLDRDFGGVWQYLADPAGGANPVMAAVEANQARLDAALADDALDRLRGRPQPLLPPTTWPPAGRPQ